MAGTTAETLAAGEIGQDVGKALEAPIVVTEKAELPGKFVIPEGYGELPRIARVPFYFPKEHVDMSSSFPIFIGSHQVNVVQDHEGVKLVFLDMLSPNSRVSLRTIGRDGQVERTKELDLGFVPLETGTQILIKRSGEDSENVVVIDDNLREEVLPSGLDKIKKVLVVTIPMILQTEGGQVDFSDIDPLLHAIISHSKDGIVSVQRASENTVIYVPNQLVEALRESGSSFVPSAAIVREEGAVAVVAERKLPEISVDKSRLIGAGNEMEMKWLAAAVKLLSKYQKAGELPGKLKQAGEERTAFIGGMKSLREKIYRLEPKLQKKVLLAALGEEEQGISLIKQFDREFDKLLLSWGADLLAE